LGHQPHKNQPRETVRKWACSFTKTAEGENGACAKQGKGSEKPTGSGGKLWGRAPSKAFLGTGCFKHRSLRTRNKGLPGGTKKTPGGQGPAAKGDRLASPFPSVPSVSPFSLFLARLGGPFRFGLTRHRCLSLMPTRRGGPPPARCVCVLPPGVQFRSERGGAPFERPIPCGVRAVWMDAEDILIFGFLAQNRSGESFPIYNYSEPGAFGFVVF